MRYIKTIFRITLIAIVLFSVSCSGPSKKSLLVKYSWRFSDVTSPATSSATTAALINNRDFLVDQIIKFKEDNTFDSSFPDPQKNSQGNWEMNSDETKITLFNGGNKITWDIQILNEAVFEMRRHDDALDADLIYHYTIQ